PGSVSVAWAALSLTLAQTSADYWRLHLKSDLQSNPAGARLRDAQTSQSSDGVWGTPRLTSSVADTGRAPGAAYPTPVGLTSHAGRNQPQAFLASDGRRATTLPTDAQLF